MKSLQSKTQPQGESAQKADKQQASSITTTASQERCESKVSKKSLSQREDELPDEPWMEAIGGFELRLWGYDAKCSRLTLQGKDRIAKRKDCLLVFHDVSYIEMPLRTGSLRARRANREEYQRVVKAVGQNYTPCNIVALCASQKRIFLIEYGYVQWLGE